VNKKDPKDTGKYFDLSMKTRRFYASVKARTPFHLVHYGLFGWNLGPFGVFFTNPG